MKDDLEREMRVREHQVEPVGAGLGGHDVVDNCQVEGAFAAGKGDLQRRRPPAQATVDRQRLLALQRQLVRRHGGSLVEPVPIAGREPGSPVQLHEASVGGDGEHVAGVGGG